MAEFEGDFGDLFPSPAFLAARGIDEVVATTQGLEGGRAVGPRSRITRRYDAEGKLTFSEEHDGRAPIWTTRVTRMDATHRRESIEHGIRKTTAVEDVTTDAAGREQDRVAERFTERFSYEKYKLVRVTRAEGGRTLVKRFRYDGTRLVGATLEEGGRIVSHEAREYDAAGRETRRTTTRDTSTPVEVRVEYDALGCVASIAIHEGEPILKKTLRYEGELLVEERTKSFVPAVGSAVTTFAYRRRAP